ncbi:MAG: OmpA family protein [Roseovarius sp.]|nr:OmpA family protein [Roseovarius sp.]
MAHSLKSHSKTEKLPPYTAWQGVVRFARLGVAVLVTQVSLAATPAAAIDFSGILGSGFSNPREKLDDRGCAGGEFWVSTNRAAEEVSLPERANQRLTTMFVLFDDSDEQYTHYVDVWHDYTDLDNPVFVEALTYSDGLTEAFNGEGGPVGVVTCLELEDVTPVSATPRITSEAEFISAAFVGYVFDATDTRDGLRYRYTVGYEGLNDTVPVFRRELAPQEDVSPALDSILTDDLLQTTRTLSSNVSRISRDAADRLRISRGQECGEAINGLLRSSPVQFASDSFFIDSRNDAVLDEVARLLGECANSSFLIAGHTDSDASEAYNIVLSQNRVDAVRRALAERGVVVDRLRTQGFGESRPIATNATPEGKALNRRVEFIWLGDDAGQPGCGDNQQMTRNLNGSGNDDGARMDGNFLSTGYDCASSTYRETWAELNVTHEDDRGTFGMLSTGMLRERQGDNRLFGQFVEGYVSRSDVDTRDASGTITGIGIHAGLYGARGFENGLIMSYYGSAATGRHSFEIDTGALANGHYTYAAIFAGGALGGELKLGEIPVKPRVGIDLAYAEAIGSEISLPDITFEIDPAKVARGYAEVAFLNAIHDGLITITPRLFCETNGNQATDACGVGGSIDYATTRNAEGREWKIGLDYEAIDSRQSASLDTAHSREILDGMGVSRSSLGANMNGALELGQTFEIKW